MVPKPLPDGEPVPLNGIVGVILSFKHLIDDALYAQLKERIPVLFS